MTEDVHDSNCAPSTNEKCDVAGQPNIPLSSANTLMRLCILPSGEIGQGGRWVWEGGEAPCLAAWCVTVGNTEAAVRHSVGASLTYADICCVVLVAASVSLSMWPRCHVGVAVVEQGV